ncbi:hypothetical protein [Mesoterricola silvestris]|nr:hypothetical protein [Mesoterricola silvestris]
MIWKPAGGGVSALVTVVALDLDRDRAQVHVKKASTGACAAHWVDMALLAEAGANAQPCSCVEKPHEPGENHAA